MAQTRRRRCSVAGRNAQARTTAVTASAEVPVRGVPLKFVSLFTMAFAALCLAAFLAGRAIPPDRAAMRNAKLFSPPPSHADGISIPPRIAEIRERSGNEGNLRE